jgi:hypothetical protein
MDKCILTNGDIEKLFEWRDRNMVLVRRNSVPVKAIELIMPEAKLTIKYVRENGKIKIYLNADNKERFKYTLDTSIGGGQYTIESAPDHEFFGTRDFVLDIAGCYFALMALMTYGDDVEYTTEELDIIDEIQKADRQEKRNEKPRNQKKKAESITYLFNREPSGRLIVKAKGKHASPHGVFNVRGHFRHYKDGRVIWIAEYKKGTGKRKNKIYKL